MNKKGSVRKTGKRSINRTPSENVYNAVKEIELFILKKQQEGF